VLSSRTFLLWRRGADGADELVAVVVGVEALELLTPRFEPWEWTSWIDC
jgi:hypothetical protein